MKRLIILSLIVISSCITIYNYPTEKIIHDTVYIEPDFDYTLPWNDWNNWIYDTIYTDSIYLDTIYTDSIYLDTIYTDSIYLDTIWDMPPSTIYFLRYDSTLMPIIDTLWYNSN